MWLWVILSTPTWPRKTPVRQILLANPADLTRDLGLSSGEPTGYALGMATHPGGSSCRSGIRHQCQCWVRAHAGEVVRGDPGRDQGRLASFKSLTPTEHHPVQRVSLRE